ncbi:MAG TPA: accessory factor UbiK family protein [Alphaproteobacteria bacterium]|nr:accessory factor UbiK family protein [Alphaproteobacteria bacterium]
MQTRNPLLDDLARMLTGAASAAQGLRREIDTLIEGRLGGLLARLDLVGREEFEVVEAMVQKARVEQEALKARLAKLEASGTSARAKRARKPRRSRAAD